MVQFLQYIRAPAGSLAGIKQRRTLSTRRYRSAHILP